MRVLTSSRRPRPIRARAIRPTLEGLEGRALMAGPSFTNLGGSGIASEVVTHNASGQEELFVRLASSNAVYSYNYSSNNFTNTGGSLSSMVADDNGITGINSGNLYHYDDQNGYTQLGTIGNAIQVVVTHGPSGQEEAFARLASTAVYEYNFSTGKSTNTGGFLDSMTADDTGITGTSGGSVANLFHYQDGSGYFFTGGSGITNYAVTHNLYGQNVVFVRTASYGGIFYYNYSTHQFTNTGGVLDQFVSNAHGISGTINGLLFYYNFGVNFYFTGASNVTSEVVSHDPIGREQIFAEHADTTFWDYVISANEWHIPGDKLDQMIADDTGITGTNGGSVAFLYHYQDATTDLGNVNSDYLLRNSYFGSFTDTYSHYVPPTTLISTGTTTGHISLTISAAVPSLVGYLVWGTITVTDSSGYYDYSEPFIGYYSTSSYSGYPSTLEIQNLPGYGSYPPGGYSFRFLFDVTPQGNLTAANNSYYGFIMSYASANSSTNDNSGQGSGNSNANLSPTS